MPYKKKKTTTRKAVPHPDPDPEEDTEQQDAEGNAAAAAPDQEPEVEEYEEQEEDNNANEPVGKKKKFLTHFDEDQEESMVEWLRDNPVIYNKKMRDYKDTSMKERLWELKATEVGKTKVELQTWYKSIRTRYGRLKKKASGSGDQDLTERDEWILQKFLFLRPFIAEMPSRVLVSMKTKVASTVAPVQPDTPSESEAPLPAVPALPALPAVPGPSVTPEQSTASVASVSSKYKKKSDDEIYSGRIEIMDLQKQLLERLNKPQPMQERDSFCDYLKSVMYGFDPNLWRKCQVEMLHVLQRYQELNDHHQYKEQQQQPIPSAAQPPLSQPALYSQGTNPQVLSQGQQCSSSQMWQPGPSQWPTQVNNPTSVWGSQETGWVQQQQQQQQPVQVHQSQSQKHLGPSPPPSTSSGPGHTSTPQSRRSSTNKDQSGSQTNFNITGLSSLLLDLDTQQQVDNVQPSASSD